VVADPNDPTRNMIYFVTADDDGNITDATRCWPAVEPPDIHMLNVGLDRGSIGASGSFFTEACEHEKRKQVAYVYNVYFDKIHRVVRCIKNAMRSACGSVYMQMVVWTAYVWDLNFKPFKKGAWEHEKQSIIDFFLEDHFARIPYIQEVCCSDCT